MSIRRKCFALSLFVAPGCYTGVESAQEFRAGTTVQVTSAAQLNSALSNLQSGDEVVIAADGNYGQLDLVGRNFDSETLIRAADGVRARFDRVRVTNCSKLTLDNLQVRPLSKTVAVLIDGGSQVTLENSDIGFGDHSIGWTSSDWSDRTSTGVEIRSSSEATLRANVIHHVTRGIETDGYATDVNNNWINYFSDDGVRVFGDDSKVRSNRITNNVKVNGNTNVGIQSSTRGPSGNVGGGRIDGLLIWGNTIIESTDPGKPFGAPLQGIGFYDGIYGGLLVAQNLVSVDSWRGIVVFGGDSVNVQYNTVVDSDPSTSRRPDVAIDNHKNGTPSVGARLRYNIAARLGNNAHVAIYDNLVVNAAEYTDLFDDHVNFDFQTTPAVPPPTRRAELPGAGRNAA